MKKLFKGFIKLFILIFVFYIFKDNIYSLKNKSFSIGNKGFSSKSAYLYSLSDEKVVYKEEANKKVYPASLTKIMTGIVALENIRSLDDRVVLNEENFVDVYTNGAAAAGFEPGEMVTKRDLLYGVLVCSGAEATEALGNSLGGEDYVVKLMNEKAVELGMDNTRFTNLTGLHDERHVTTVEDMGKLFAYALKNNTFREIVSSREYYTDENKKLLPSRFFSRLDDEKIYGYEVLGGKTGYTGEAGLCLASWARKNNKDYILVTTGADGGPDTEQYNFSDAYYIYEKYLE